ncbi:PulJ/GspJ family protein [Ignatzschineria ureiclastica]|nr:hypothetical protein [Ignatzschineria ureiclastica]
MKNSYPGSELGQSLFSMLIGLTLFAIILLMISIITRSWMGQTILLKQEVELLDSLVVTEDLLRKEFETLLFAPYCPSLLPSYSSMMLGVNVDRQYRDFLQQSLLISSPTPAHKAKVLNLHKLQGRGSGQYSPEPVKKLQRLVEGSELFYLIGLKETGLSLQGAKVQGEMPASLIGIREALFYLTDCRNSMLLSANRKNEGFELSAIDLELITQWFDQKKLQIYVVQEYLVYLQIRDQESFLVIDYMDGQAFYRAPYIVDVGLQLQNGVLTVLLVSGITRSASAENIVEDFYGRTIENGWNINVWPIEISLE